MSFATVDRTIYFIKPVGCDGPVRIGCSRWPESRLRQHLYSSPLPLEIVATTSGDFRDERALHRYFSKHHSHCEWFHWNDELSRLISDIKGGVRLNDAVALKRKMKKSRPARTPASEAAE